MHRHMSLFCSPVASDQGNTCYQHGVHPGLARWCPGTMTGRNITLLNCAMQSSWLAADGTLSGWPPEDDIRSVAALPLKPGHGTVLRHRYSVTAQCYDTVLWHSVTAQCYGTGTLLDVVAVHMDTCRLLFSCCFTPANSSPYKSGFACSLVRGKSGLARKLVTVQGSLCQGV